VGLATTTTSGNMTSGTATGPNAGLSTTTTPGGTVTGTASGVNYGLPTSTTSGPSGGAVNRSRQQVQEQ
jgi:hypothetical protein